MAARAAKLCTKLKQYPEAEAYCEEAIQLFEQTCGPQPGLKGSVGEGPNQTNYSDRSLVRILSKLRNFR